MKKTSRLGKLFKEESIKEENLCMHKSLTDRKVRLVVRDRKKVCCAKVNREVQYIAIKRKENIVVVQPMTISPIFSNKDSKKRVVNKLKEKNIKCDRFVKKSKEENIKYSEILQRIKEICIGIKYKE